MPTHRRKSPRPQAVPCQPLCRVQYTTGQLLGVEEFTTEQAYVCEKLRRHNRIFHRPGVATGLEVTLDGATVHIAPGVALDGAGNEICVPVAQTAPVPTRPEEGYVVLRYREFAMDPIPVLTEPGEATSPVTPSRIQESFVIGVELPDTSPPPIAPPDPAPPVRLARLRQVRGRWKVDGRFRRRSAR